jgi:hypothetical protein
LFLSAAASLAIVSRWSAFNAATLNSSRMQEKNDNIETPHSSKVNKGIEIKCGSTPWRKRMKAIDKSFMSGALEENKNVWFYMIFHINRGRHQGSSLWQIQA